MSIPRKALATAASGSSEGPRDRRIIVAFEHTSRLIVDAFHQYLQTLPMIDRMKRLEEETDGGKKYKIQFAAAVSQVTELVWTLHKNALPDDDLAKHENRHATAEVVHHGFMLTKDGSGKGPGVLVRSPEGDEYTTAVGILNTNPARARELYGPLLQSEAFLIGNGPHPNENYTTKYQINPDTSELERTTIVARPERNLPGATIARPQFGQGSGKSV